MSAYRDLKVSQLHYEQGFEVQDVDDLARTLELQKRLIRNELSALVVHTRKMSDCAEGGL